MQRSMPSFTFLFCHVAVQEQTTLRPGHFHAGPQLGFLNTQQLLDARQIDDERFESSPAEVTMNCNGTTHPAI